MYPSQDPDLPERSGPVQWHLVEFGTCGEQGGFIPRRGSTRVPTW
jgi:hypothetical protein